MRDERLAAACLILALEGARRILSRLRAIRRQVDPCDPALESLLDALAADHRTDIRLLEKARGRLDDEVVPPNVQGVEDALEKAFPSFAEPFGEGWLSRDAALHFVELLEEEAARFYGIVADPVPAADAQFCLYERAWDAGERLERLRSVLL